MWTKKIAGAALAGLLASTVASAATSYTDSVTLATISQNGSATFNFFAQDALETDANKIASLTLQRSGNSGNYKFSFSDLATQWDITTLTIKGFSFNSLLNPSNLTTASDSFPMTQGTATFGTNLSGVATITYTAAVPEPESYAMLLAGLAMIGMVAKRRRK